MIRQILDILSGVSKIVVVIAALYGLYLWVRGIAPALYRLGMGLARRKIAIFAKPAVSESLRSLLVDSGLFKVSNLVSITHEGDVSKAAKATIFLVYWPDWSDRIPKILKEKRDSTALIMYAPQDKGPLPPDAINQLDNERNVVLCNFRGRLLNDIVASIITTSYEKR